MAQLKGPPNGAVRNQPITPELRALLNGAADSSNIEKIVIVSGGQTNSRDPRLKNKVGGWTGSHRHDGGRAADIELVRNGHTLSFTDVDGSQVADFITACAGRGAIGIGAGEQYMGPHRIHVGFGQSEADHKKIVWGANGDSARAPLWLRAAARAGWGTLPTGTDRSDLTSTSPLRSTVSAREGLWLRKGAGVAFDRSKLLEPGTALTILGSRLDQIQKAKVAARATADRKLSASLS